MTQSDEISSLLQEIRNDLVNDSTPLSSTLRKAKILAFQIGNEEFKQWVHQALSGYDNEFQTYEEYLNSLPSYRKVYARSTVDYATRFERVTNMPLNPPFIPNEFNLVPFNDSIKTLEDLCKTGNSVTSQWESFKAKAVAQVLAEQNKYFIDGRHIIDPSQLGNIIDTTKNRLLDFMLELEQLYPAKVDNGNNSSRHINKDQQVTHLFYRCIIHGDAMSQGDKMTNFDQRNQQVKGNQYNAGRDINFGNAGSKSEFVSELEELQTQVIHAIANGELDEETATEVEYHLAKAIQQAKKPEADKKTLLSHLGNIKNTLQSVASTAGIVTSIAGAIEVVDKLF